MTRNLRRLALLLALAPAVLPAAPQAPPSGDPDAAPSSAPDAPHARSRAPLPAFRARYELSHNGEPLGEAEISLEPGAHGAWTFVTESHGSGGLAGLVGAEIHERTVFRWRDGLPELIESDYDQQVAWKRKQRHLRVDAERGVVEASDEKRSSELPYSPNLLDRHVTVLALAADRARGRTSFEYTVADKHKVEPVVYRDAGTESVETPAGRYRTERIERVRQKNPGRTTTSWLAPELGYLPVRLLQREPDGDTMEMRLVRMER